KLRALNWRRDEDRRPTPSFPLDVQRHRKRLTIRHFPRRGNDNAVRKYRGTLELVVGFRSDPCSAFIGWAMRWAHVAVPMAACAPASMVGRIVVTATRKPLPWARKHKKCR